MSRVIGVRGDRLAAALVILYGLAALACGFSGQLGPAMQIASTDESFPPSAAYLRLAEDADRIVVAPCERPGVVIQVHKDVVRSVLILVPPATIGARGEADPYRVCP